MANGSPTVSWATVASLGVSAVAVALTVLNLGIGASREVATQQDLRVWREDLVTDHLAPLRAKTAFHEEQIRRIDQEDVTRGDLQALETSLTRWQTEPLGHRLGMLETRFERLREDANATSGILREVQSWAEWRGKVQEEHGKRLTDLERQLTQWLHGISERSGGR